MQLQVAGLRARALTGVIVLVALWGGACRPTARAARVHDLTIATGPEGGVFHRLATDIARELNQHLTGVRLVPKPAGGSTSNAAAVEQSILDCAFARADVAYAAYSVGTPRRRTPHTRLRAIAVMHRSVLHVVTRADSRIRSVTDLRGARVIYGRTSEDGEAAPVPLGDLLTAGFGLKDTDFILSVATFDETADGMAADTADAALLRAGYPIQAIDRLAKTTGIRLLEISPDIAVRIRARYPFYKPAVIPPETYRGQPDSVWTVGVDNLLVCQRDLDESLVHRITRALFESLSVVATVNPNARQIDPELAPTTPIPLHSGASQYYRERELFR